MWGAFFSWGVPMFVIGCMTGAAFAPRRGSGKHGTRR